MQCAKARYAAKLIDSRVCNVFSAWEPERPCPVRRTVFVFGRFQVMPGRLRPAARVFHLSQSKSVNFVPVVMRVAESVPVNDTSMLPDVS